MGDTEKDLFCSEKIRDSIFYKTRYTMAVCDIAPVLPGHSLIIPIRHVDDPVQLTDEEVVDMFNVLRKIKPVLSKVFAKGSDSYNLTAQIGKYSGMSIPHLHMHVIPRASNDEFQHDNNRIYDMIEHSKRITTEEMASRVTLLKKELERNDYE